MSVVRQHTILEAARARTGGEEALVFAAASILTEMSKPAPVVADAPIREVVADGRRYRLEGRRLQSGGSTTGPIILVFVEPQTEIAEQDAWRHEFQMTRKEARVARLLAEGRTNQEVAAELSISPHTARHHTERVLSKLGVKSRRDIAAVLSAE